MVVNPIVHLHPQHMFKELMEVLVVELVEEILVLVELVIHQLLVLRKDLMVEQEVLLLKL